MVRSQAFRAWQSDPPRLGARTHDQLQDRHVGRMRMPIAATVPLRITVALDDQDLKLTQLDDDLAFGAAAFYIGQCLIA